MTQSLNQNFRTASLLRFALPSMVMMIFMSLYTIVDGIFVSRFVGSEALSAVNLVYPVISVVIAIGVMLASGGSAVIARKLGEGKHAEACSNMTFLTGIGIAISLILLLLTLLFMDKLIFMLGANESLYDSCEAYLRYMMYFAPCCMLQSLFQCFFVTAGKPSLGLVLIIAGGIANAILDYVFMGMLCMGVTGAALATGIGQLIPAVCGVVFFIVNRRGLCFGKFNWDTKGLLQSCSNGSSEMVSNLSNAVITYLFNIILMNMVGADGVAAIAIILYGQFMFNSLYLGFSMGVAPIISFQHGAKNRTKLKTVYHIGTRFVIVSAIVIAAVAFLLSEYIVRVFIGVDDSAYELAVTGFALFALNYLFSGFNIFTSALFTALSDGKTSAIVSFSRTFICIVASLMILPKLFGIYGVWLAVPVAELITVFLAAWYHRRLRRTGLCGSV